MKETMTIETTTLNNESDTTRLAAIDIGTNSIRCIVVEVDPLGNFRVLDDEKAMVRLGEGLTETGFISDPAKNRAIDALQRMTKISHGLGAEIAAVVATSAVRKALNRNQFLRHVKKATGLNINVISGTEEAELAGLSVHHNFALDQQRYAMADIGGGSVEIVIATGRHAETVISLELGAVFLTEKFLHKDPPDPSELKQLRKYIRKKLKKAGIGEGIPVSCLIGSGGTMTNLGSMIMAMRGEQYESVHRYEVLHSEIIHLLSMLCRKKQKERLQIPGLNPERADIILAGMILTDELMRRSRTNQLRINAQGIREGLILQSMHKRDLISEPEQPRDWRNSILEFAGSCRFDKLHSLQVNHLAQKIFTAVAPMNQLTSRHAELLEAAAILHDIGYFISYDRHHKHSYHLIRHANLFGFTPREREIIANLARYHRKAKPKKNHDNFSALNPEDQKLVRQLGGILRLADGLDRRRNGQVTDILCRPQGHLFTLKLQGQGDLSVEIYGAKSKGDLFESAFDTQLNVTTKETQ
ncbi:Ppx/GppA phosphatase family protein [uncultured Desulfuromusa sp.]|uniref:Ppx/GppA phosphatase family protein n=1 Tax=uncultured Desulfuromusa sp. TaxID=219183 RepID=UPI002AA908DB|nr:Ppx/GppA phosphatase family protein [uncultured Desulfuromusa sp.]